jgi:hypothetical protein
MIKLGEKYRAVSATTMNATSSRSHRLKTYLLFIHLFIYSIFRFFFKCSLFILTLIQRAPDGSSKTGAYFVSHLPILKCSEI